MDILSPNTSQSVQIAFKINFKDYWNQARIYYTTDGSTPSGSFGVGDGTTMVLNATYQCGSNPGGGVEEIVRATIPSQSSGTEVKYIVSAWHSGGGDEIFGNGCGNCGNENRPASAATLFQYSVSFLPIELTFFTVQKSSAQTGLLWSTTTELNNSHFDVQRSADSKNWETIGTVQGNGTTLEPQEYRYTDRQPLPGINYYRLKQVDYDGQYEYSKVVSVDFGKGTRPGVLSPNPVGSELFLTLPEETDGAVSVAVFDLNGRIWQQKDNIRNSLDVSGLPQGIYFVKLVAENGRVLLQERFVKE